MKVFIVGSLNMDLVIRAPFVPEQGMTIHGEGFMSNPGGKGANQAVAVSKLGASAYMVGAVGKEFGEELASTLRGYGVNCDFLAKYDDVSSGIAVIVVTDGDNRIILEKGANARLSKEQVDKALEQAEAGDYLVAQLETDLDVVTYALNRAKEKGMTTVLNPAPAQALQAELLSACDYFMPNQTEAEFYTGIYPSDEKSARECAKKLGTFGVRNIVVTMGSKGAAYVCDGKYGEVEAVSANAIDTTAAGDTFVGGFVTALSEGKSVEKAIAFANKAASVTVTRRGAQQSIPYRKEIE
ncbi:MAG: ribokinase [Clostridia bacterium]|nr:ribokinase [Clostridia bacterium]